MSQKAQIDIILSNGQQAGQTLKELQQTANRLNREIKDLKPGSEEFTKKSKDFQQVTGRLKDVRSEVRGVTQEQKGFVSSLKEMLPFGDKIGGFSEKASQLKGQIGGLTKGTHLFKAALWSIGIGLIITAVGALVAILQKTQAGMDQVTGAMEGMKAVVDELLGRLINLGKGLWSMITGDFKKGVEQLSSAFSNLGEDIAKAFNEGRDIALARKELERFQRQQELLTASLRAYADQQRAIADDATRSFKERELAAEQARINSEQAAKVEMDLAKQRFALLDRELAMKRKNGLLTDELAEQEKQAKMELIDAENNLTMVTLENEKQRAELKQDRLERDLDILIDGFDNIKTINEKIIESDRLTIDEKRRRFEELKDLSDTSFDEQIRTIEQFTNAQVDANDLLATEDAKLLNQKIRSLGLSEIIEGRLLEIIRERRTAVSDFSELERSIDEAAAKRKEENIKKEEEDRKAAHQSQLTDLEILNETREISINESFANRLISEEERQTALYELEANRLQSQLELIKAYYGESSNEAKKATNELAAFMTQNRVEDVAQTAEAEGEKGGIITDTAQRSLATFSSVFGGMKGLYDEGSKEYKDFALIQGQIDTINAALAAYRSTAAIPIFGPGLAPIAAAAAFTFGQLQQQKIQSVKKAKFGALLRGSRHSAGGIMVNAEDGEIILNRNVSQDPIGLQMASDLNAMYGGIRFMEAGGPVNPLSAQQIAAQAPAVSGGSNMQSNNNFQNTVIAYMQKIDRYITSIRVINNVQDTREGLKVINNLEQDAGF
jgi:uncharacterized protein YoxC